MTNLLLTSFFILIPLSFLATQTQGFPYNHSVIMFEPAKEMGARFLTLILFSWLVFSFFFLRKELLKTPLYFLMLLLLAWQGLSLTWSLNPYQGLEYWIHWLSLTAFFVVCLNLPSSKNTIPHIMKASLVTATLVCWISILCAYFNVDLPFYQKRVQFPYAATFGNPKFAAEFVAPLLFWGGGLLMKEWENKKYRIFYLFCMGSCLFALFFIYKSRSALIGLAIPLGIIPILYFKTLRSVLHFRKIKFMLWMALGAGILLFLPYAKTIFSLVPQSNSQRVVIWLGTLKLIKDYFWRGVGIGNFNLVYPKYITLSDRYVLIENHFVRQTHNEYLQIFSELGIVGLLLILALIFFVFRRVLNHLKNNVENKHVFTLSLFLSWITYLVMGFFAFNFQNPATSFTMMATLGFLIRHTSFPKDILRSETLQISPSHGWKPFGWKPLGAMVLLALILIAPKPLLRSFLVKFYQLEGQSHTQVRSPQTLDTFKKALAWDPHDWETHFLMAKAYEDNSLFAQAIDHLTRSLKLNPYYENSHYNLGFYYEKNKQTEEAVTTYQSLLAWMPDYRKANLRLAQIAYDQKKFSDVEKYLKNSLSETPPHQNKEEMDSSAFLGLALCEFQKGNLQKSHHYMNEALLSYPKNITENPTALRYWLTR